VAEYKEDRELEGRKAEKEGRKQNIRKIGSRKERIL
jgi:hypothetical protein